MSTQCTHSQAVAVQRPWQRLPGEQRKSVAEDGHGRKVRSPRVDSMAAVLKERVVPDPPVGTEISAA